MKERRVTMSSLPRLGRLCIGSEFFFGLCIGAWSIALNFHLNFCGISDTQLGTLLSVGYIVTAVVSFFIGRVGDIKGYPVVMSAGMWLMGGALVGIALVQSLLLFYLCHMVYCAGLACAMSMEYNLPLSLIKEEQRQYGYNLVLVFYFLGSIIGNLLCTVCFGTWKGSENPYQWTLLICGGIYAGLAIFRGRMPRRGTGEARDASLNGIRRNIRSKKIVRYLLYGFLTFGLFSLATGMLNMVLREWHGLPDKPVSLIFMVNSGIGCLMLAVLPRLTQRYALHRISTVAMLLQFVALALMAVTPTSAFVAMMFLRTATCNILYTSVDSPMLRSIEADRRGTYMGMRVFSNYIGMSVAAVLSGWFVENDMFSLLFIVCAVVALAQMGVYHLLCRPYLKETD